ncbi:MAG TPA: glycosyltransferase family 2 protein [Alphaproteobacteria bacterium]|nr:glycosyltransferase family 2 protein [Alphaproteobacteria bacterium]
MESTVSIVIPTIASAARAPLLWRALDSVLRDQGARVIPIVVANGQRFSPPALDALKSRSDIRFFYREEGSAVGARLAGREAVDTEFFAMLDDDDEFLPGAVAARLASFKNDPAVDVVVTNGFRRHGQLEVIDFPNFAAFPRDPLWHLMSYSWLQPAAGLYRSATIHPGYFAEVPRSMEWTYLAARLALERRLRFVDTPTYRMHRETAESLSASRHYQQGEPEAIRRMMALEVPARIRKRLKKKYAASLHFLAELARQDGEARTAWGYHLRSLAAPYGLRYLSYTRHLLRPTGKKKASGMAGGISPPARGRLSA